MQENTHATEQKEALAHLRNEEAVVEQGVRMPVEEEGSLAARLRHGDRTAAKGLVDRYYERVYLFMRAMGHDRQTSEDLTQETFLRAWYHIGQLRDGKALNGWLFRIAGNVSRLYRRRHKDKTSVGLEGVEPPASGVDGSQRAGERERLDQLHEAVARLPWKLRQAIVLHYMGQLTIAEAAEAARVHQGTLKSRLNRGLEALRKDVPNE